MKVTPLQLIRTTATGLALVILVAPFGAFARVEERVSTNWAGYVATNAGFEGVGGTWKIPEVKQGDEETAHATWVGIGGYGRKDLIQSGTIAIRKSDGKLTYAAWVEILPDPAKRIPVKVSPGDTVSVSMEEEETDEWHILFTNETTKKTYETTLHYHTLARTADWIQEMPSRLNGERIPLDRFSPVTFTDTWALKNGKKIPLRLLDVYRLNMVDLSRKEIARTGAVKKDNETFTVTRTKQRVTEESVNSKVKGAYRERSPARRIQILW